MLGILLLPLVLIGANTVLSTLRTAGDIPAEGTFVDAVIFIGQTPVALLITLLVATYTLGTRGRSLARVESILNDALGPICAIILITGAGGMFGGVLRYSGIGTALSDSLADLGLPLIVSAFVIATILRVAQGSATVALTTTAGLISRRGGHRGAQLGPAGRPGDGDRRRRHRALPRQRLRVLAGRAGSSGWTSRPRCAPGR